MSNDRACVVRRARNPGVVSDVPHITFTGHDFGHAVSTSSATIAVSSAFVSRPVPPDEGFHVETKLSAPPAPAAMLTTPLEFHHAPLDLVIAAAAMGAIVERRTGNVTVRGRGDGRASRG